ncbi:MAG TPA: A24 family peptidase [Steroidobacteraceae bacterium]|jgi:leader peptidase (prepilin peptidase)/N-methyltransferase|nr:A24 family peptidase [Steroidobacteraceae bacterium]
MLNDLAALYASEPVWFAGSVFVLSLMIGSFLNVVIYRLPLILEREWRSQAADVLSADAAAPAGGALPTPAPAPPERFTLSTPRSACPSCKAPIKAWQNIPVVSWLALRGRCSACKTRISPRYPLVELTTAVLSAWVAWHFGFGWPAAGALLVTWSLIALTGIDIDHQLLPDSITLPLMWAGLVAAVAVGPVAGAALPVSVRDGVIGAAAGYLSLWLVFHAFKLVTGKEGMGYGDFKLFAALGAWLGWKLLPLVIILSAATGAVLGILMIVLRGRDRSAPMPFGPYLAAAGWIAMMYGDALVNGYLRVSGLKR